MAVIFFRLCKQVLRILINWHGIGDGLIYILTIKITRMISY